MIVLALDPSSVAIGWAVNQPGWPDFVAAKYCPTTRESRSNTTDLRHREMCGRASNWLADTITREGPSVLVIEMGGGRIDRCSERLRGALLACAWIRDIATIPVHPNTWQAWAKRRLPERLAKWREDGKPDDESARMMLAWALETQTFRTEAA